MAAGNVTVYSHAVQNISQAAINLASDTIVCTLLTSSYTPAPNTDATWADVSANELTTASGYTAGGIALSSVTDNLATATVTFDAANVSWASFSATFKYAVLVKRAGGALAGTDKLIAYLDCNNGGGSVTGSGGALTIQWNASGIFTLTHSP